MPEPKQTVPALLPEKGKLTRHRLPLHALTGVRFFAAAWVVLHHTRASSLASEAGHPWLGNFFANGNLAVPLFFILSGFILAYTYRDQIETGRDRVAFWQARFARIWPGYAFSLLVASVVLHSTPLPSLMIASLFMVQGWNPWHIIYAGTWNSVCWTLSVEAFFYLVFPWLQVWVETLKSHALFVVMTFSVVVSIALNAATLEMGHVETFAFLHYVPFPVAHLPEFILGVALGNLFLKRLSNAAQRRATSFGLLTYSGIALALVVLLFPSARWTSTVLVGFAFLVYGLASERTFLSRFLSTRVLLLGGGISYSMYLLQTSVRGVIDPLFDGGSHFLLGKLVMFVVLIVVSWAVFAFLEEPSRKFLRRRFASPGRAEPAMRKAPR